MKHQETSLANINNSRLWVSLSIFSIANHELQNQQARWVTNLVAACTQSLRGSHVNCTVKIKLIVNYRKFADSLQQVY